MCHSRCNASNIVVANNIECRAVIAAKLMCRMLLKPQVPLMGHKSTIWNTQKGGLKALQVGHNRVQINRDVSLFISVPTSFLNRYPHISPPIGFCGRTHLLVDSSLSSTCICHLHTTSLSELTIYPITHCTFTPAFNEHF